MSSMVCVPEFQSTAQRTAGRNAGAGVGECFDVVSIHRPAHSRAEPRPAPLPEPPGGFNPPPSAQPGGTGFTVCPRQILSFNPPPSAQPGGTQARTAAPTTTRRFNPPPSAQPGGTAQRHAVHLVNRVSIHRPAHSRAERAVDAQVQGDGGFQSTAQRTAGRNGEMRGGVAGSEVFQSTAQRTAGRNRGRRAYQRGPVCFNPPPSAQPGGTSSPAARSTGASFNPPPSAQPGGTECMS